MNDGSKGNRGDAVPLQGIRDQSGSGPPRDSQQGNSPHNRNDLIPSDESERTAAWGPAAPLIANHDLVPGDVQVIAAGSGGDVVISGDPWFLRAEFTREGSDLWLRGADGQQLLIQGYFRLETPPDIRTPDGVVTKGALAPPASTRKPARVSSVSRSGASRR